LKNFILTALILLTTISLSYAAEAPLQKPAARSPETITLILEEAPRIPEGQSLPTFTCILRLRHEYVVPRNIAQQAQTIGHLIEEFPNRQEFPLGTATTPAAMQALRKIMWAMHNHSKLSGKALLNALEAEINLDPAVAFDLLRTANYLDFKPVIEFVARTIAKNPALIKQLEGGFFRKQNILPKEMLIKVAWYYYLLNNNDLRGVDESSLNYSVQDYLNYKPNIFAQKRDTFAALARLNLSHLRLNSLEGIESIVDINQIQILNLSYNHLRQLPNRAFQPTPQVLIIDLSHNQITQLTAEVFLGIPVLYTLDLSNNRLHELDQQTLQILRQINTHNRVNQLRQENDAVANNEEELEPQIFRSWLSSGHFIFGPYLLLQNNLLTEENKDLIVAILQPQRNTFSVNIKF
jgi:hypothetical protein